MTSVRDLMARPTHNHEPQDTPDPTATCATCKRHLHEGEAAWASDWRVVDVTGRTAGFRMETRYTCDDCEAAR